MSTPITTGEATFEAIQSSWSRALVLTVVAWLGVVTGFWVTQGQLNLWDGNPLVWFFYQLRALLSGWGYLFLGLQILAFAIWAFTDSFRFLSLATSFLSNVFQIIVVERTIRVDLFWFVLALALVLGPLLGLTVYRQFFKHRQAPPPPRGGAVAVGSLLRQGYGGQSGSWQ